MPAGGVVQVAARLAHASTEGAYRRMTFAAPGVAALARPGQFVALTVGGRTAATLLRRSFSILRVDLEDDTVEIVVAAHGPGTVWLTEAGLDVEVDLVGPLGRPFPLPTEPVACVLVGGGYGSAPLFWLAQALRERGCHTELILGAASADRLFGVDRAREAADGLTVTTDDGSMGTTGWVTHVLPGVARLCGAAVVYACGPMPMLRAVTEVAGREGAVAQVAVEEAMACAIGVCMTCVLPVRGRDGHTRMVRACVEGPVFPADRVRWDALGEGQARVPGDAVGAPAQGGH